MHFTKRPFLFWHSHLLHFQLCTPLQTHLVLHFLKQGNSSGISKSLSTLCPLPSLPCKGTVVTKQPSIYKPRKEPLPKTEPCHTLIWNSPASLTCLFLETRSLSRTWSLLLKLGGLSYGVQGTHLCPYYGKSLGINDMIYFSKTINAGLKTYISWLIICHSNMKIWIWSPAWCKEPSMVVFACNISTEQVKTGTFLGLLSTNGGPS